MISRLKIAYDKEIIAKLMSKLNVKNKYQVPKLTKIVLNMGLGLDATDNKKIKSCVEDMTLIAGQKAIVTKYKKSIANFKTRKGTNAGIKVTLRSQKMYEFLDRLINVAMPRIRDFRGVSSKSFDGRGNYAMGLKEHLVFPEIEFDKVDTIWGMDIVLCTTSVTDGEAKSLLKLFNMPFIN